MTRDEAEKKVAEEVGFNLVPFHGSTMIRYSQYAHFASGEEIKLWELAVTLTMKSEGKDDTTIRAKVSDV